MGVEEIMNDMTEDLGKLGSEIEEAKSEESEFGGRIKEQKKRLNDEFSCKTLDGAKKEISDINRKEEKLDKMIDEKYKKLKEDFEW